MLRKKETKEKCLGRKKQRNVEEKRKKQRNFEDKRRKDKMLKKEAKIKY